MKQVGYFVGGEIVEIEVEDGTAEVVVEIERENQRTIWREKKRKGKSLDALSEQGVQFADGGGLPDSVFESAENRRRLMDAIKHLQPQQQALIHKIYFEGRKKIEIAREEGVSHVAIHNRLQKIFRKIKKYFD